MKKEWLITLFSGLIFLQVIVPVGMIARREITLKNGVAFRFKTAPVDPYDAFRGRYVALRVEANRVLKPAGLNLTSGQRVYAILSVDQEGFAYVSDISLNKPREGSFIKSRVLYASAVEVALDLLIDRYYMEENAAPRAEMLYAQRSTRAKQDAYVTVKVRNGFLVVDGLYIGGEKIEDVLKKSKS